MESLHGNSSTQGISKLDAKPVPALSQTLSVRMYAVSEDSVNERTIVTGAKSERHMPTSMTAEIIFMHLKYSNPESYVNMKL